MRHDLTVPSPVTPLLTERLSLRFFEPGDLDDFVALYSLEEVVRYLYWEVLDEVSGSEYLARRSVERSLEQEGDILVLAVTLAGEERVIGDVVLKWVSAAHAQGEVGFTIHPELQGHGYASEAAEELLRFGFEEMGFHRICARCDGRNAASAGVMARLGMREEAHFVENELFKGEWGDELVYAILDREWREKRSLRR